MQPTPTTVSPVKQQWTVLSLLEWSTNHLLEQGFAEARLHVELLLAHILKFSRLQLYTNFDRPLALEELTRFKELFKRRLTHEPLQYILGETEFMGLPFFVDSNVLIPRPETELLVEKVIEIAKSMAKSRITILDIGTGSGNIPVAIAKFLPDAEVSSMDVSTEAIRIASRNAGKNDVAHVSFLHQSVFEEFLPGMKFDIIVSNPPYISAEEFVTLQPEVRDFEPRVATTDETDGLRFIRRIASVAPEKLASHGFLLMEIGYDQSETSRKICEESRLVNVEVLEDYAGHPRIVIARKAK